MCLTLAPSHVASGAVLAIPEVICSSGYPLAAGLLLLRKPGVSQQETRRRAQLWDEDRLVVPVLGRTWSAAAA